MAASDTAPPASPRRKGGGREADGLINIGRLVKQLQVDFPDLSVSKIRYLEDRGLVSPTRTSSGYRKYSRDDVRTLRAVLSMQRDQYLPLEVIRRRVIDAEAGAPPQTTGDAGAGTVTLPADLAPEQPKHSLEDLCRMTGVDEEFVLALVEFHLLVPAAEEGLAYTESDVETTRVCQRLARHTLEPRNLRMLSSAAEREAALIEQIVTPSLRSGHADRREYGLEVVRELGTLFSRLTQLLFTRELRRVR